MARGTMMWVLYGTAVALAAMLTGCRSSERAGANMVQVRAGPVLGDAMCELAEAFEAHQPGIRVVANATCPLCLMPLRQTEPAAFDVVVSIGAPDMDRMVYAGLVDPDSVTDMGGTRLALVVRRGAGASVTRVEDLAAPTIRSVLLGDPSNVSVGHYAEQALRAAGVWEQVKEKITGCRTGCEVLKTLVLGDADAGFIYEFCLTNKTEASAELACLVPPESHDPIRVLMGITKGGAAPAAVAFRDFALGDEGSRILRRHGLRQGRTGDPTDGGPDGSGGRSETRG